MRTHCSQGMRENTWCVAGFTKNQKPVTLTAMFLTWAWWFQRGQQSLGGQTQPTPKYGISSVRFIRRARAAGIEYHAEFTTKRTNPSPFTRDYRVADSSMRLFLIYGPHPGYTEKAGLLILSTAPSRAAVTGYFTVHHGLTHTVRVLKCFWRVHVSPNMKLYCLEFTWVRPFLQGKFSNPGEITLWRSTLYI